MRISRGTGCPVKDCTAKLVDLSDDVFLHTLDGIISETVGQDPTLAGMRCFVDGAVSVSCPWVHGECVVEVGFTDVGFETIDGL
jgi:hypothetical protein